MSDEKYLEPYEGTEPYIFVSYAREDKECVYNYISELQKLGTRVWYDQGIHAGDNWKEIIIEHINNCSYFCFFVSENSLQSSWCKKEIGFADKYQKKCINIFIQEINKNKDYYKWFAFDYDQLHFIPAYEQATDKSIQQILDGFDIKIIHDPLKDFKIENGTLYKYLGNAKDIVVPDTVTSIGEYVFYNCDNLTKISIPNGIKNIGNHAFENCRSLKSITVYKKKTDYDEWHRYGSWRTMNDTEITDYIDEFLGYGSLCMMNDTEVRETNKIGDSAFNCCSSLTSVTIPDGITSIDKCAFWNCSSLTSVTLPSSVKSIGKIAFYGCNKLVEVCNKSSLAITKGSIDYGEIGYYALNIYTPYNGESKLSTDSDGYIIYTDGKDKILMGYTGTDAELTLPSGITEIHKYAFYNYNSLTSITIPNGVTSIGDFAFFDCSGLTNITIPNGVTSIGNDAFYGCSGLTSIAIPSGVTSIGNSAFHNCSSLASITIPDSVTGIGEEVFYGCSSLTNIAIPNSVTSIGYSAFYYSNSLNYNEYDNGYYIGNENNPYVVLIKAKSTDIRSCTINEGCRFIHSHAFDGCSSLTNIIIPDNITSIEKWAFYNCSSLTSVTIPSSVANIGYDAFSGCTELKSVYFRGSEEEWKRIKFDGANENIFSAEIIFNHSGK